MWPFWQLTIHDKEKIKHCGLWLVGMSCMLFRLGLEKKELKMFYKDETEFQTNVES